MPFGFLAPVAKFIGGSFLGKAVGSLFGGGSSSSGGGVGNFLGNLGGSYLESRIMGNLDYQFKQQAAEDNIRRMQALGLTPQEIAGSPAAGGMTASGPTLGNAPATQLATQQQEREKDRQLERQKMATSLAQTEMQTRATLGAAQTAANASTYATDIRANTDANRLSFDKDQFELTLQRHPHELKKLANEAHTSSGAFITYMKALGMSAENLKATAIYAKWESQGFDILDPEDWASATDGDRDEVMRELAKHASTTYREWQGGRAAGIEEADNLKNAHQTTLEAIKPEGAKPFKIFGIQLGWQRPAQ